MSKDRSSFPSRSSFQSFSKDSHSSTWARYPATTRIGAPDCGLLTSVHRSAPLISKYASNVPITQRAGFALFRKNKFANQRSADRPSPRKVYPAASCGFCKKSRFAGHRAAVGKYRKLRSTHISGTTRKRGDKTVGARYFRATVTVAGLDAVSDSTDRKSTRLNSSHLG